MRKPLRRALLLVAILALSSAGVALADTVRPDVRPDEAGNQPFVEVGELEPGEVVTRDVTFTLVCEGVSHAVNGSTITVQPSSYGVPLDGGLDATSTTISVPREWMLPSGDCSTPTVAANGPSTVTITAPTVVGEGYLFSVMYARLGSSGITGATAVTFEVDVVAPNTPPTLVVPSSMSAEATSATGATVVFTAGASDVEDDPDPTPTCTPASGEVFAIGETTVTCTVTDLGGLTTTGSFAVTVGDSTAPVLVGVPAGLSLTTSNPAGAPLVYTPPTATDAVDSSPTVTCTPPPGEVAPVGESVVACTATDDYGNSSTAEFPVSVTFNEPTSWSAVWGEPTGGTLIANHGRTVPVKVAILAGGVEQTSGSAVVRLTPCGGGDAVSVPLAWSSGRWSVNLDTSMLAQGCYVVAAVLDGHVAGSFNLELRGGETFKASTKERTTTAPRTANEKPPKK